MPDAKYFRDQAQFCLEMACQMSDRQTSAGLKKMAAQYHQRALDFETARSAEAEISPASIDQSACSAKSR